MSQPDPRPQSSDPLIGLRIDHRYLVRGVLGRGGMGVVYDGMHLELERPVAIKVLTPAWGSDPEAVERFLREARTASSLSHSNIVDVSDLGRLPDGRPYLIMPKITGMDLAVVLSQSGHQPAKRVAELLSGVASALDLIHAKGYVHRDIKPENLMYVVREDGSETVMLLDFGIAALVMSNEPRLTRQGTVFGTPEYLPPEVCNGQLPDGRGDVYALATVAFELITGRLPFRFENPLQLIGMKVQMPAASLSRVSGATFPAELEAVMARGLARSPDDRHATASELVDALKLATSSAPMSWRPGVLRSTSSGQHPIERESSPAREPPPNRTARFDPRAPLPLLSHARGAADLSAQLRSTATEHEHSIAPRIEPEVWKKDEPRDYRPPRRSWPSYGMVVAGAALLLALGLWLLPPSTPPQATQSAHAPAPRPLAMPDPAPAPAPAAPIASGFSTIQPTARAAEPEPETTTSLAPAKTLPTRKGTLAHNSTISANMRSRTVNPEPFAQELLAPEVPPIAPSMPPPAPAAPEVISVAPEPVAAAKPVIPATAPTSPREPPAAKPIPEQAATPAHDPELARQLSREGTSALLRGKVTRAVDVLRGATQADPANAAAWRGLGLALERGGRPREAANAYRRYLNLEPNGEESELVKERMRALHE